MGSKCTSVACARLGHTPITCGREIGYRKSQIGYHVFTNTNVEYPYCESHASFSCVPAPRPVSVSPFVRSALAGKLPAKVVR